jgi:Zn finger protein HypA/HybF involved in hydrogenase expression
MPRTEPKDWQCQECGKRMTAKQAERATNGDRGCPKCGGFDIDLAVLPSPTVAR